MRLLVAALLALLGVTESPQRVIVQVDHLQKIEGVILGQSEDGLHIRTRAGEEVLVNPETAFQIVLLMDVEQPEQVIVHMRDGRQIRGLLHTDGWDAVKVDVHGVMLTLGRKDVAFVQPAPDIAALCEASRSALADSDEHGRLALARWLITQKAWALAQSELQSLVDTFDNIEAAALLPHQTRWRRSPMRPPRPFHTSPHLHRRKNSLTIPLRRDRCRPTLDCRHSQPRTSCICNACSNSTRPIRRR